MTNRFFSLFLAILFMGLYLLPLGVRPLIIPDETRYAEIPREMVATGDWVVPRINGGRYFEKPVMGYWLTAVSLVIFGQNNFAVRLPMALATGCTGLLIFFLCRKLRTNGSWLPWLGTLVYLTSISVAGLGTSAILDPVLSFFLSGTLICFFLATESVSGSAKERKYLLFAGVMAGFAFITKGFLAFAIPVIVAGPYLIVQLRWNDILRMLWLPMLGAIVVSLPWAVAIYLREPAFWSYFFWIEHVHRFLSDSAQHKKPFWIFLAALPGMFLPWIFLLPTAIAGIWKKQWEDKPEQRLFIFCLCWFLFPFLFFSISKGKLITYILPCFPPLAILFSIGLDHVLYCGKIKKSLQYGIGITGLLSLFAFLTLIGLNLFWTGHVPVFDHYYEWVLLGLGFLTMALILLISFYSKNLLHKILLFSLTIPILVFSANFTIPALTLQRKAPASLILRHRKDITPQTYILSGEQIARAVCWYLKRQDIYMVERAGELQHGMDFKDYSRKLLSPADAAKIIQNNPGQVVLIADYEEYSRWESVLPPPLSVDNSGSQGFVFLHY